MKKFLILIAVIAVGVIVVLAVIRRSEKTAPINGEVKTVTNGEVTLGVGEKVSVAPDYDFTLVKVNQDTRCPAGEECTDGGAIATEILVRYENGLVESTFVSSDDVPKNIFGYVIGITDVKPLKPSGKELAQKEYKVVFSVKKGSEESPRQGISLRSDKGVELILYKPFPEEKISSPLRIEGMAPGNWFFEANSPVTLTDWDGKIIVEKFVMAEGEWMTTNMVPFSGEIIFTTPAGDNNRGFLIIKKDNASGLPEHDDAVEIPILFE